MAGADFKEEASKGTYLEASERDQKGFFVELQSEIVDQLFINAGVRADDNENYGSHNSYRQRTFAPILQYLFDNLDSLPPGFTPAVWDYDHADENPTVGVCGGQTYQYEIHFNPNVTCYIFNISQNINVY